MLEQKHALVLFDDQCVVEDRSLRDVLHRCKAIRYVHLKGRMVLMLNRPTECPYCCHEEYLLQDSTLSLLLKSQDPHLLRQGTD